MGKNIFKFLGKKPRQLMRVLPGCSREKKKKNIKIVCEIFIHMKMKNPKIFKLTTIIEEQFEEFDSEWSLCISGHSCIVHVILPSQ